MQDEVKVSQADREEALPILCHLYVKKGEEPALFIADVKAGKYDDHYQIQAFARHRHQAERDTLARMEPVAWMYQRPNSTYPTLPSHTVLSAEQWTNEDTRDGTTGLKVWTETPLYARPLRERP